MFEFFFDNFKKNEKGRNRRIGQDSYMWNLVIFHMKPVSSKNTVHLGFYDLGFYELSRFTIQFEIP